MTRRRRETVDLVVWVSDDLSMTVRCHSGEPNLRTVGELRALLRRELARRPLYRKREATMAGEMIGLEEFGELTGRAKQDGTPERRDPPWRLLHDVDASGYRIQRRTAVSRIVGEPDTWETLPGVWADVESATAHIRELIADEQMRPAGEG